MDAAEVIKKWHDRINTHGQFMDITITATQRGTGAAYEGPILMSVRGHLVHLDGPDELLLTEQEARFFGRVDKDLEVSTFTFHSESTARDEGSVRIPVGYLQQKSLTTGKVHKVVLTATKEGLLTGVGPSIDATGPRSFWVVTPGNRVKPSVLGGDPRDPDGEYKGTPL